MNLLGRNSASKLAYNVAASLRPQMAVMSWGIYSCVVVASNGFNAVLIGLGLVLFIAMYGIVALHNDLSDVETDKANRRSDIPFSTGKLTERQVVVTIFLLSVTVTIIGAVLHYHVLLWVGLYLALGYAYSGPLNVKSRGVFAALLLGFCYGAMPWLIAGAVTNQFTSELLSLAFISCIFSSGIIVIKDFKDIKGDAATHKNTLLVRKGAVYTRRYYLLLTCLAYILSATYSYVVTGNGALAVAGLLVGGVNYWLLADTGIFSSPESRSTRGGWARALFFTYALLLYFML